MKEPRLSVVVVGYNMAREIPRTIRSLSPTHQREIGREDYEVVVVDNGSTQPFSREECARWGADIRFLEIADASVSPARAANAGIAAARGELIGVLIDGARLASPGLLQGALRAAGLHARPVIASLAFHLGPGVQKTTILNGYDQAAEDRLLEESGWTADGYRLFGISVFASSSQKGWFGPISESNALFLRREQWAELRGYDERFEQPGGGLLNLDTYKRACDLPDSLLVVLLGEGTFHQVHGGITTNSRIDRWAEFHEEYMRIRGAALSRPLTEPLYLGYVRPTVLPSIAASAAPSIVRTAT